MTATVLCALGFFVVVFAWRQTALRKALRAPVLDLPEDHPLMEKARRRAQDNLGKLQTLWAGGQRDAQVRLQMNATELFVWARVNNMNDHVVGVHFEHPTLLADGRVVREAVLPLSVISDWRVELPNGRFAGGFSQLAKFTSVRDEFGELPEAIRTEALRYDLGLLR